MKMMENANSSAPALAIGLSPERLQTLVDGVLAILLTLRVLELRAPELLSTDPDALWAALRPLWPKFFSFLVSFGVLSVFWFSHRMEYHYVRRTDRLLIWFTLL